MVSLRLNFKTFKLFVSTKTAHTHQYHMWYRNCGVARVPGVLISVSGFGETRRVKKLKSDAPNSGTQGSCGARRLKMQEVNGSGFSSKFATGGRRKPKGRYVYFIEDGGGRAWDSQ